MAGNRLLQFSLLSATAVVTVLVTVRVAGPGTQQEAGLTSAQAVVQPPITAGAVLANPFGAAMFSAPVESNSPPPCEDKGFFSLDEGGQLVLNEATLLRLDSMLVEMRRASTSDELADFKATTVAGMPQESAQQALRILEAFDAYAKAEAELRYGRVDGHTMSLEELINKVVDLRLQYFGRQLASALFAAREVEERRGIRLAMGEANTQLAEQE